MTATGNMYRFRVDTTKGFGHIVDEDFIYHPVSFYPESDQLEQALTEGLLPDEANHETPEPWFVCRSTRIDVAAYRPSKTAKRLSSKIDIQPLRGEAISARMPLLQKLYDRYNQAKGFTNPYNLTELLTKNLHSKQVLLYYYEGLPVGYVVQRLVDWSVLSLQFVWDYAEPKLSLGTVSQLFEVQHAREYGFRFVYLMPAYERSCLYKADFKGLQWFTGSEWSTDMDKLKALCINDSQSTVTYADI